MLVWDLSSLTRDWIQAVAVEVQNPNHSATKKFPQQHYFTDKDTGSKNFKELQN